MKLFKIILISILAFAVIILPHLAIFTYTVAFLEPRYDATFVGELDEKFDRLTSIEEDKIIVVGGSSVAFGIDSALVEEYTGMPTVNFGLYAALGTKLMLDLSRAGIEEGDIVIIAPEIDAQTLSLYFNTETTLQAMDSDWSMLKYIRGDNIFSLVGGMWDHASRKIAYRKSGTYPDPGNTIYRSDSFNELCDIKRDGTRKENSMSLYYDPNTRISFSEDIASSEFIDYLNDYIAFCKKRGASVYFSFCPMNSLAIAEGESISDAKSFEDYLESVLDCPMLGGIENSILEPEYFFDTNFHLNDSGMLLHSSNLTKNILLELGIPTYVDTSKIPKPQLPESNVKWQYDDENAKYFTFVQEEDGCYAISGLSELGLKEKSLTLPYGYNDYKVRSVMAGAFRGSQLCELIIPENTNLEIFETDAFSGASNLVSLVIYHKNGDDIMPPASFAGVSAGFTVYVPEDSNYEFGYYWSERGLTFERIEE